MKPKRIILVRHGESEGNLDSSIYRTKQDYKLNLTPKGLQQALEVGVKLKEIVGDESVHFYVQQENKKYKLLNGLKPRDHE